MFCKNSYIYIFSNEHGVPGSREAGRDKIKKILPRKQDFQKKTEAVGRNCLKLFEARRPNFSKHSRGTGGGVKNFRCVRAQGVKMSKFSEGALCSQVNKFSQALCFWPIGHAI